MQLPLEEQVLGQWTQKSLKPQNDNNLFTRAESAAAFVLSQTKLRPRIGLVLGSGLGAFADELVNAHSVRANPDLSALHSDRPCRTACHRQSGGGSGGGDAGTRPPV